jgi:hypothetical protein
MAHDGICQECVGGNNETNDESAESLGPALVSRMHHIRALQYPGDKTNDESDGMPELLSREDYGTDDDESGDEANGQDNGHEATIIEYIL